MTNDLAAAIETLEAFGHLETIYFDDEKLDAVVVLPTGRTLHSLKKFKDEYLAAPERIETTASILTVASLIEYVNRFKNPDSAVFVSDAPKAARMKAVLDFHGQGEDPLPRFGRHLALYQFPISDPFAAWTEATKAGLIRQPDFAEFLQAREYDIENPPLDWMAVPRAELDLVLDLLNIHDDTGAIDSTDALALIHEGGTDDDDGYIPRSALYKLRQIRFGSQQRLMALSRGIEVSATGKATAAYDPKTGARTVNFTEEHETTFATGRKVIVPDLFFIHIPIFQGGARHLLPVRLRYRLVGGAVTWAVELMDGPRMIRLAIAEAAAQVAAGTDLPVYFGMPE